MNVNSYYINSPGTGGESVLNTPKRPSEQRGAFWSALSAACADKPGSSEMLFRDISMIRDPLSQVDIACMVSDYSSGVLVPRDWATICITGAWPARQGAKCRVVAYSSTQVLAGT